MNKFNEKCTFVRGRKRASIAVAATAMLLFGTAASAAERSPERDQRIKERRQAAARRVAETSLFERPPALKEDARIPEEEVKIGDYRISDAAEKGSREEQQDMKLERERAKYPR